MNKKGYHVLLQIKQLHISAFASSTAFFLFLSLMPMLVMVCTIVPYTPLTEENLVNAITDLTPDVMDNLVEILVAEVYAASAGILSIAIVATMWSAGKGVMALMNGLNMIAGVKEDRNYFLVRIVSSLYTLIMILVMIASLFLMVFGNEVVGLMLHRLPQLRIVTTLLMRFRFVFVWLILTVLFAMIYTYIPNERLVFKKQIPGAIFSAVLWSIFSEGFSLYVESANHYSIYGSLTIIILVMIWIYFCMYIVLIGAYINHFHRT